MSDEQVQGAVISYKQLRTSAHTMVLDWQLLRRRGGRSTVSKRRVNAHCDFSAWTCWLRPRKYFCIAFACFRWYSIDTLQPGIILSNRDWPA